MGNSVVSFIIEFIGTVAFACSGAVIAIKKKMDLFGAMVLALSTAVGGGIIRDLILGLHPPTALKHPIFSIISIITAIIIFSMAWYSEKKVKKLDWDVLINYLIVFDAIGLGAFTVNGIAVAYKNGYMSGFLLLFVGVLTGVGGGVIRDILADTIPFILSKHVYASASLIGGIICIVLIKYTNIRFSMAMIIGAVAVAVIRCLAAYYKWNLPRLKD